ncbi:copper chaperone CopZ [Winogradskyella wandonensis]|uniref:Copper chaperone CopZ n=1 Tax=Winogradskyella wandonensis TaxID=1442586 RepID=A0A4R1KRS8_9FLAO|nr:heavy-metal-associated domain-containing protein [Winogradskyella wandonensis]TCK67280.1 copper chaperone CopZ [Winogradskyella wandonensis]
MTHTYHVSGMTCGSCKAAVEKALQELETITSVDVQLQDSLVTIVSEEPIFIEELQKALPEKYKISEKKTSNIFSSATANQKPKSKLKQLFPLVLILGYIFTASLLLNKNQWNLNRFMYDFMGLFFIVFSFFKFLDLKGFSQSFRMYDPLAKRVNAYSNIYPFIELALGLLFLMRLELEIALIVTVIILTITTIGVAKVLLDKKAIQCACLGTVLKLPMTTATLIENSIMLVMAFWMILKIFVL